MQSALQLMITFLLKADKEKDRRTAGAAFLKQLKRWSKTAGAGEEVLETIMEAASKLVTPPYKKYADMAAAADAPKRPPPKRPSPYSGYPGGWVPAQAQVSPNQVPAGYQLTPIAQSRPPPPNPSPPRGVGISSLRPTEVFQAIHFSRPCTYCTHANHAGCVPRTTGFVFCASFAYACRCGPVCVLAGAAG